MAYLIAQGDQPQHRWRRPLPADQAVILGRSCGAWSASWDDRISRRHAEVRWQGGRLDVARLPSAKNPVFLEGRQLDRFLVEPGQRFVIGSTTFSLDDGSISVSLDIPRPAAEKSFSPEYLHRVRYRDAEERIDVLSRLPDVISSAADDDELVLKLVAMILTGVPSAHAAAVVVAGSGAAGLGEIEVLHWDHRGASAGGFRPSQHLIEQSLKSQQTVAHVWGANRLGGQDDFTQMEGVDWAFCTPVPGDVCRGWAIYLAGRTEDAHAARRIAQPQDLRDDAKFTELVAATLRSVREVRQLERRQSSLRQFFSPLVLDVLAAEDPERALAPRESDVTVLFCDLRGFSRESERLAHNLFDLLNRVSRALGVMTQHILRQGGVIGDFHGDAAMGFWGWPIPQEDTAQKACSAALAIREEFIRAALLAGSPLTNFRIGIGIASGKAVAGKIGSLDQVKVTAFGPVVNVAARLESMTEIIGAPILLDETTARAVRVSNAAQRTRVRRLAVVRPAGMEAPVEVHELLPAEEGAADITNDELATYDAALEALVRGDWDQAQGELRRLPQGHRGAAFLLDFIGRCEGRPPETWDGVIRLRTK